MNPWLRYLIIGVCWGYILAFILSILWDYIVPSS